MVKSPRAGTQHRATVIATRITRMRTTFMKLRKACIRLADHDDLKLVRYWHTNENRKTVCKTYFLNKNIVTSVAICFKKLSKEIFANSPKYAT